jgi:Flp pilus assembly protein TadG
LSHPIWRPRARRDGEPDGLRRRGERGSQTLQLAVIVPGILLLVFTIFQASMYYWAKSVATAAARQGATAAAGEDATAVDGRDRALEFLDGTPGGVLQGAEVTVDRGATLVTVTVEGSAIGPLPGGWDVSQTAQVPIEEFTTDEGVG